MPDDRLPMPPKDYQLHSRTERYNKIYKAVNDVIDMPAQELWTLVDSAACNDGVLSKEIRAKLSASGYERQVAIAQDAIARLYQEEVVSDEQDEPIPGSDRLYRTVDLEYPQRSDATVAMVIERGQWRDWFSLRLALQREPALWSSVQEACRGPFKRDHDRSRQIFWDYLESEYRSRPAWRPHQTPDPWSTHKASDMLALLTNLTGLPPVSTLRLSRFSGCLSLVRSDIYMLERQEPLETETVIHKGVSQVKLSLSEMLRQLGVFILLRNARSDYEDFWLLANSIRDEDTVLALRSFDALYPHPGGGSPLQQLLAQLAWPYPEGASMPLRHAPTLPLAAMIFEGLCARQ